jgi:putative transposase
MERLKEADSQALQESLRDLDRADVNFFEGRARFPAFKTGQGQSLWLPYSAAGKGRRRTGLSPEGGLDRAPTVATRGRPNQIGQLQNGLRRSLARSLIQEFDLPRVALPQPQNPVGVDLGLIDFATFSNGESIPAPRFARKAARRQRRAQTVLSRRKKGGHRRKKAKRRLRRVHQKVAR